jgi:tRNA-splicing ligase RtcB
VGTLGGGNHFIELCYDQNEAAWVMLHSGSRHIGKALAEVHIDKAKGLAKEYFINLPDPDLAYLVQTTQDFKDYINAVTWAQKYAFINRQEMMRLVLKDIGYHLYPDANGLMPVGPSWEPFQVNCHHNYISHEHHNDKNLFITRKGAVSAKEGEYGIIPGSMGARSFIVKGKGNKHSYHSCSHGAGRIMGRKEAERRFTIEDAIKATEGVECRKDAGIIDEIPQAYKDIDAVMSSQADLVDIVFTLKQVLCIKG